jgi:hypothetical protein
MHKIKWLVVALAALAMLALPGAASAKDRDDDRMPDRWERKHDLNVGKRDGARDPDRDGLSNRGEFLVKSDPRDSDSDSDGVEDGDEDADRDRVDNANEIDQKTHPRDRDSDDDGIKDGDEDVDDDGLEGAEEDATGNDPDDADTDDDGTEDGDEAAGWVASFNDPVLTLRLADGTTLTGRITKDTEIDCETEDEHESDESESEDDDARSSRSGDDSSDDNGDDDAPGSRSEHEGDEDDQCLTSDLAIGVRVHEAEFHTTESGVVFEEIEILG